MTGATRPRPNLRRPWTAASLLKGMLVTQCVLAGLVVLGDLPPDMWRGLPGLGPAAPATDVQVSPGDQTRRFDPRRLPLAPSTGPGFPGDAEMPDRLTFTVADIPGHDRALVVTGAIEAEDSRRFDDYLASLSEPPSVIALHSPGGLVHEALAIGRAIRAADLPTLITPGAACFSACPYMLAGGTTRTVSREGLVGVHQHYFGENTLLPAFLAVSDVQSGQGEVMAYLDEMGVDPLLMAKALVTPPDDIYILLPDELQALGLATELAD